PACHPCIDQSVPKIVRQCVREHPRQSSIGKFWEIGKDKGLACRRDRRRDWRQIDAGFTEGRQVFESVVAKLWIECYCTNGLAPNQNLDDMNGSVHSLAPLCL